MRDEGVGGEGQARAPAPASRRPSTTTALGVVDDRLKRLGQRERGEREREKEEAHLQKPASTPPPRCQHFLELELVTDKRKTGDLAFELIEPQLAKLESRGLSCVAFVSDNGSDFRKARRLMKEAHPLIVILPCISHQVRQSGPLA